MDFVILNGVKSTTLKGFLISSLPPISKPLMRVNVEQIDGRDGDIISELGYSAYDKQMSIGLFGDYDVNEVIKYFNSEGEVIFSNELDKYYKYKIIQQIDFEKLIRFKTATVTFHVQPFKYSAVETKFVHDVGDEDNGFHLVNGGNIYSKPRITIYGSGIVNLYINGEQYFLMDIGEAEYITLDGETLNASTGETLMNRHVAGNLDKLRFNVGNNTIAWDGNVTKVEVENFVRWI